MFAATLVAATVSWVQVVTHLRNVIPLETRGTPAAIVWSDRVFRSEAEFARWLRGRGISYERWVRTHPKAVAILRKRDRAATPARAAAPATSARARRAAAAAPEAEALRHVDGRGGHGAADHDACVRRRSAHSPRRAALAAGRGRRACRAAGVAEPAVVASAVARGLDDGDPATSSISAPRDASRAARSTSRTKHARTAPAPAPFANPSRGSRVLPVGIGSRARPGTSSQAAITIRCAECPRGAQSRKGGGRERDPRPRPLRGRRRRDRALARRPLPFDLPAQRSPPRSSPASPPRPGFSSRSS